MRGDGLLTINTGTRKQEPAPRIRDPLESIECAIAFSVRDYSEYHRDAWIFGIVFGWDEEPTTPGEPSDMERVKALHGWSAEDVAELKALHQRYKELKRYAEQTIR